MFAKHRDNCILPVQNQDVLEAVEKEKTPFQEGISYSSRYVQLICDRWSRMSFWRIHLAQEDSNAEVRRFYT